MERRIVVLDACQAITYGTVERLDLITDLERHDVAIGARASREVVREPAASLLRSAIADEVLGVVSIDLDDPGEAETLTRYEALPAFQGRGDSEVLAIAERRGHLVGTDDEAMLRAVGRESAIPGYVTSLDWLIWAIRESRIEMATADRMIDRLDIGPRLRTRLIRAGRTLEDLV